MINIHIGLYTYELPTSISELNIQNGIDFSIICKKHIPKNLKKQYESLLNKEEVDLPILEPSEIEPFLNEVIHYMGNVPMNILKDTSIGSKLKIYYNHLEPFVLDILFVGVLHRPSKLSQINIDKQTYYLPKSKNFDSIIVPMYNLTAVQFAESSDLLANGFSHLHYVMAILVSVEPYNEETIKAEPFKKLPLDTCFDVLYTFNEFYVYATKRFPKLFAKGKGKSKGMSNSWNEFLLDIYKDSNYLLPLEEIKQTRVLEWFEVKNREFKVIEFQNKQYEKNSSNL